MLCSVIICTRNRARSLRVVLESLCASDLPNGDWELVVVDNGSDDDTPAVAYSFLPRLPVRIVSQPVAGLSNARNRGVEVARGDYIVWTDDDVEVRPGWLSAYFSAFERAPHAAIFGGWVIPKYEHPSEPWFTREEDRLATLLAKRTFVGEVDPSRMPFGANYAIRTAEQRQHAYDPGLGVAPGRRTGGEETQVLEAVYDAGGRGIWVTGAVVDHVISLARQSRRYIREFYRAHGSQHPSLPPTARPGLIGGAPGWVWREAAKTGVGYYLARAMGAAGVAQLVEHARAVGTLDAWRSASR